MEPDPKPVLPTTVRKSALPSLPKEAFHTPVPEPVEQVNLFPFQTFMTTISLACYFLLIFMHYIYSTGNICSENIILF
jgi:hypothetical protein